MALDDLYHNDKWHRLVQIRSEERQLSRILLLLAPLCVIGWFVYAMIDGYKDFFFFIALGIGLVIIPVIGGFVLNFAVALLPYRGFTYRLRFFRYYLVVLILIYFLLFIALFVLFLKVILP